MTLEECVALLAPLAMALRAPMDAPTFRAYHRILKNIPARLCEQALEDLSTTGLQFMPTAPEIQAASERARRRLLALHPYEGCVECEGHPGMRQIAVNGQPVVEPCPCKTRWQARLAGMGLREPIAQLPGEAGVGENEQVYPTLEQLPAAIRQQIADVAGRKALK